LAGLAVVVLTREARPLLARCGHERFEVYGIKAVRSLLGQATAAVSDAMQRYNTLVTDVTSDARDQK
jgi:hypothetical protein